MRNVDRKQWFRGIRDDDDTETDLGYFPFGVEVGVGLCLRVAAILCFTVACCQGQSRLMVSVECSIDLMWAIKTRPVVEWLISVTSLGH